MFPADRFRKLRASAFKILLEDPSGFTTSRTISNLSKKSKNDSASFNSVGAFKQWGMLTGNDHEGLERFKFSIFT